MSCEVIDGRENGKNGTSAATPESLRDKAKVHSRLR
jgi:hypothetical protein